MSKRNYTSAVEYTSKKRKITTCDEEDELDLLINMERKKYYTDSDSESDSESELLPLNKVYKYPPEPDEYTYVSLATHNKAIDKIRVLEENINKLNDKLKIYNKAINKISILQQNINILFNTLQNYREHYNYMVFYIRQMN